MPEAAMAQGNTPKASHSLTNLLFRALETNELLQLTPPPAATAPRAAALRTAAKPPAFHRD